jgi:hypothetical protein
MVSGITAIDWLGYQRFRIGAYVVEKNGRLDHAAQITAIHPNLTVSVVFVATGYHGHLALEDLELVEEHMDKEPS